MAINLTQSEQAAIAENLPKPLGRAVVTFVGTVLSSYLTFGPGAELVTADPNNTDTLHSLRVEKAGLVVTVAEKTLEATEAGLPAGCLPLLQKYLAPDGALKDTASTIAVSYLSVTPGKKCGATPEATEVSLQTTRTAANAIANAKTSLETAQNRQDDQESDFSILLPTGEKVPISIASLVLGLAIATGVGRKTKQALPEKAEEEVIEKLGTKENAPAGVETQRAVARRIMRGSTLLPDPK